MRNLACGDQKLYAFFIVGRFRCGKIHQNKKLFMNNSVETLIPFNKGHQGPLKLHVSYFSVWGKWEVSRRGNFL